MAGRLRRTPPRLLGSVGSATDGPLLVVVGGLHGNEPGGVIAADRVCARLAGSTLGGRLVALSGNRGALMRGKRFLDRDLNRMWSEGERSTASEEGGPRERIELLELERALAVERDRARGEVVLLDLHSTSAPGAPFCVLGGQGRSRQLALSLGIPVLLGLQGSVPGTLVEFATAAGWVALCVEGGEHGHARTIAHHEAAIWSLLDALDMLPDGVFDVALRGHRERLARAARGLPRLVEIAYRHALQEGEEFRMLPGFQNFAPVRRDALLARTNLRGSLDVRAPFDGLLVMPRYQGRGEDGFFLGREVPHGEAEGAAAEGV